MGARNFPEKRTVPFAHSQGAERIGFPRKTGPGQGIPGLWPPHPAPAPRGAHVPGPTTSPAAAPGGEPGNRAAGTRRRSPPSLAGPTGTGRRVLTLAGGAGRGRTVPRAAPIR